MRRSRPELLWQDDLADHRDAMDSSPRLPLGRAGIRLAFQENYFYHKESVQRLILRGLNDH